jgi:hypothetical protein
MYAGMQKATHVKMTPPEHLLRRGATSVEVVHSSVSEATCGRSA